MQNALRAGSGLWTQNRWNVPAERPEVNTEVYYSEKTRNNSGSEPIRSCRNDNLQDQAYDKWYHSLL